MKITNKMHYIIYYSKSTLHVSGDVFIHQQEHLTVFTVSGSVHPSCCRNNYESKQQDALYSLIYYSKSALHVSGDVFAHHQEHLSVFTVSGGVHPSCCRLAAGTNSLKPTVTIAVCLSSYYRYNHTRHVPHSMYLYT
jgi:hypothetical protein